MCSRPAFGLFIGFVNLIGYGFGAISCIILLVNKNVIENEFKNIHADVKMIRCVVMIVLAISSVMTLISALLVMGIMKRRHSYMAPWIYLAFMSILITFSMTFVNFFAGDHRVQRFFKSILGVSVQCLLFYPIYTLYRDLRASVKTGVVIHRC